MASIKLPRLPDRKPMKMVIAVLPDLHDSLTDYAAAYAQKIWRGGTRGRPHSRDALGVSRKRSRFRTDEEIVA